MARDEFAHRTALTLNIRYQMTLAIAEPLGTTYYRSHTTPDVEDRSAKPPANEKMLSELVGVQLVYK